MTTITKGYDLFETVAPATSFAFPNGWRIPAGFFHTDSEAFMGLIHFQGVPIREFRDSGGTTHRIGVADTIVYREEDAVIPGTSGSATIKCALVGLHLKSTHPIEVKVGDRMHKWSVVVTLSPKHPSAGTITITQKDGSGGTFSSNINVVPLFQFEHGASGEVKEIDAGAISIPADKRALVTKLYTVESSDVTWGFRPAHPEAGQVSTALTGNFAVGEIIGHHSHWITPVLLQ